MKRSKAYSILLKITYGLCIIGILSFLAGCRGECAVITKFEAEPEWVCPGEDFSVTIHYRVEIFDEDGEHYVPTSGGSLLPVLYDVTKADLSTPGPIVNKPGVVSITQPSGTISMTSHGVWETPANGYTVVGVAQAQPYRFALISPCLPCDCDDEAQQYLLSNQNKIEEFFGVELDDDEVMTALCDVELVRAGGPKRLCVPYVEDVTDGWHFVKEEVRAGKHIVIDFVENINPFPINVMPPGQPTKILSATGQQGALTHDFDGNSPNGKWKIKMTNQLDHDNFIKHNYQYMGTPSVCIKVGIRCQ